MSVRENDFFVEARQSLVCNVRKLLLRLFEEINLLDELEYFRLGKGLLELVLQQTHVLWIVKLSVVIVELTEQDSVNHAQHIAH